MLFFSLYFIKMLSTFHRLVISVAFVILIISFVIIAIKFYRMKNDFVYPPVIPSCPDFWQDESDKVKGSRCINKNKIGTCGNTVMNFSTSYWTGQRGMCNKKTWASACGLSWDGITNKDPCNSI
jgi:hypothetical protein